MVHRVHSEFYRMNNLMKEFPVSKYIMDFKNIRHEKLQN